MNERHVDHLQDSMPSNSFGSALARRAFCVSIVLPGGFANANAVLAPGHQAWPQLESYFAATIGRAPVERTAAAFPVVRDYEAAVKSGARVEPEQMAVAAAGLGTMARMASPSESLSQRYGSRSKKLLAELRAQRPDAAWPKVLEGVWHYEVVRRGGLLGAMALQASIESGDQLLKSAAESMPASPAAPFAHAVALWSADPVAFREPARRLIDVAIKRASEASDSPLVEAIRVHAKALKDTEAAGDMAALQRKALSIM